MRALGLRVAHVAFAVEERARREAARAKWGALWHAYYAGAWFGGVAQAQFPEERSAWTDAPARPKFTRAEAFAAWARNAGDIADAMVVEARRRAEAGRA